MAFGNKIKEILEEKELSQKELAAHLNIAPTTLSGYINNKRQPDSELVKAIAAFLEVSIDYLFEFDSSDFLPDAREIALLTKIRKMDKQEREILYDLTNIISKRKNSGETSA